MPLFASILRGGQCLPVCPQLRAATFGPRSKHRTCSTTLQTALLKCSLELRGCLQHVKSLRNSSDWRLLQKFVHSDLSGLRAVFRLDLLHTRPRFHAPRSRWFFHWPAAACVARPGQPGSSLCIMSSKEGNSNSIGSIADCLNNGICIQIDNNLIKSQRCQQSCNDVVY